MTARVRFALIALLLATLACRSLNQTWRPPSPSPAPPSDTPTRSPTLTALAASATPRPSITHPLATPTASPTVTPTLAPTASPLQLQVFEELWQTIRDEYLYPDYNGLDWDAIYTEYNQKVSAGLFEDDFYAAMEEMVGQLGDDHSVFLDPEAVKEEDAAFIGENNYVGIGILTVAVPDRQRITIILTFPGSPAEQAGLTTHDSILAVDGEPILDENGVRRDLLRGPAGTALELTVYTPGLGLRQVGVIRRAITGSMPVPHHLLTSPAGKRVGYLLLTTFNDTTIAGQVEEALHELAVEGPLDGLIIDNRHNTGGASSVFSAVLAFFANGTLGHFVDRDNLESLHLSGKNVAGSQKIPLVVLVGKNTASFGEIFSGILQDIGRAYLIGETTEGNVEILYIYEFNDGSQAWIAHNTFRPLNHPEQDWEHTGIVPDQTVLSNWDEILPENDPAKQSALEYFDSK